MRYFSLSGIDDRNSAVFTYKEKSNQTELILGKGVVVDYPPHNLVAKNLISKKLKELLEPSFRNINIKKVTIMNAEELEYFTIEPEKFEDVLDDKLSIFNKATGSVIKPVFSSNKIKDIQFFYPYKGFPNPICSESLKKEIEKCHITGIDFLMKRVT